MQEFADEIDPLRHRRAALQLLVDQTDGDGIAYVHRNVNGSICYSGAVATPDLQEAADSTTGTPVLAGSAFADDAVASRVHPGISSGGFVRLGEDRDWETFLDSDAWRGLYHPYELTDQLRTLFFAESEMIGYVAAFRRGGEQFTDEEKAKANRLIPRIYDELQLARTAERAMEGERPLHVVLDEDWNVCHASEAARVRLTPRRRELLRAYPELPQRRLIDGMYVAATRLESTVAGLFYASLTAAPVARASRWNRLSRTQKTIAELAGQGLTNAEVGRLTGVSASTVKYHLSTIFDALSVTSRTELSGCVQRSGRPGD